MGLFGGKKAKAEAEERSFQKALNEVGTLDIGAEFPTATAGQAETMEQMWIAVVSKVGGGGFEPRQVAAVSTLGERLVAENPSLAGFIDKLREIARGESARRPSDPSWRALVEHL